MSPNWVLCCQSNTLVYFYHGDLLIDFSITVFQFRLIQTIMKAKLEEKNWWQSIAKFYDLTNLQSIYWFPHFFFFWFSNTVCFHSWSLNKQMVFDSNVTSIQNWPNGLFHFDTWWFDSKMIGSSKWLWIHNLIWIGSKEVNELFPTCSFWNEYTGIHGRFFELIIRFEIGIRACHHEAIFSKSIAWVFVCCLFSVTRCYRSDVRSQWLYWCDPCEWW